MAVAEGKVVAWDGSRGHMPIKHVLDLNARLQVGTSDNGEMADKENIAPRAISFDSEWKLRCTV